MKKVFLFVAFAVLIALFCLPASAEVIGEVTETDIVAFIDYCPIESYNYKGYTYFVAEDLVNYGFNVVWNGDARTLDISRDDKVFETYIDINLINKTKTKVTFKKLFDVYETDIVTRMNGDVIDGFNIDGKTVVCAELFSKFGKVSFDNTLRKITLDTLTDNVVSNTGELLYGRNKLNGDTAPDEYGYYSELAGDFANSKCIWSFTDYGNGDKGIFYSHGANSYFFKIPIQSNITESYYKFGGYISSAVISGKSYCYSSVDGKMYLSADTDSLENEFSGVLYYDGVQIYKGNLSVSTVNSQGETEIIILAKDYSSQNGVIYNAGFDSVYYKGNVVNGMPEGQGSLYRGFGEGEACESYELLSADGTQIINTEQNLMYKGCVKNGLFNGEGTLYDKKGIPVSSGTWKSGVKNGAFKEYSCVGKNNENGNDIIIESFCGTYTNGLKQGKCLEYMAYYDIDETMKETVSFDGEYIDGQKAYGKSFKTYRDMDKNEIKIYLRAEGDFRPDGRVAVTYYNPDGTIDVNGGLKK